MRYVAIVVVIVVVVSMVGPIVKIPLANLGSASRVNSLLLQVWQRSTAVCVIVVSPPATPPPA